MYAAGVSYALGWGILLGAVLSVPLTLGCACPLRSPRFQGLCDEKLRALVWTFNTIVVSIKGQCKQLIVKSEWRKEKKIPESRSGLDEGSGFRCGVRC